MKNKSIIIFLLAIGIYMLLPVVSSVHWITGYVQDALDGELANNHEVVIWNSLGGVEDNVTGVIGTNGISHVDNVYLLDCELLLVPCVVGDNLSVKVFDSGDGRESFVQNVTVTGSGYDLVLNLTLNSLPFFENILVDDSFNLTLNEVDLVANFTRDVFCSAIVRDYSGYSLVNVSAEFYDKTVSFFGDSEDNNFNYKNNSCFIDSGYGDENQSRVVCSFNVFYYANPGSWDCEMSVNDSVSVESGVDGTTINPLISIGIQDTILFSGANSGTVSEESEIVIFNSGNSKVDLDISGYGSVADDGFSMTCSSGGNIPIYFKKYNLISSIPGDLNLGDFEMSYTNLTLTGNFEDFNLDYRQNDFSDEAHKPTFWRVYVPEGVSGTCQGNIEFAVVSSL